MNSTTLSDLVAPQIHEKAVSEVRWAKVDFGGKLDRSEGERLNSVLEVVGHDDLTISDVQINTSELNINGRRVARGQALLLRISGGLAWCEYSIYMKCDTEPFSPPQEVSGEIILKVKPDRQVAPRD